MRGSNTWQAAGELADDFIGELVGELADLLVGRGATVNLADYCLAGRVADVVKPGLNGDFGGGLREVAEGDHIGVERLVGPGEIFQLAGDAGHLLGIKTRADNVDDAGKLEIVAHDLAEKLRVLASGIFARNEIGHCEARLRDVGEAGTGLEPRWVLGLSRACAHP